MEKQIQLTKLSLIHFKAFKNAQLDERQHEYILNHASLKLKVSFVVPSPLFVSISYTYIIKFPT